MPGSYATWQDVYANLRKGTALGYDTEAGSADPTALTAILSFVHLDFETELRMNSVVAVPIDEATSPEMFEAAKAICSSRATAEYLRQANQNQGKDPEDWYTAYLTKRADGFMVKLQQPHSRPGDAVDPTVAQAYLPAVGVVDDTDDFPARFGLANIASGNSSHY